MIFFKKKVLIIILYLTVLQLDSTYAQIKESKQWHHLDPTIDRIMGISTFKAYKEILNNRSNARLVIVAIIDGGVDTSHIDLKRKLWLNTKEIQGNRIDDDHNGYVDDIHGWNFLGSSKKSFKFDNYDLIRQTRIEKKSRNIRKLRILEEEIKQKRSSFNNLLITALRDSTILQAIISSIKQKQVGLTSLKGYIYKTYEEELMLIKVISGSKDSGELQQRVAEVYEKPERYREQLKYWLNINYNPRKGREFKSRYHGNNDIMGEEAYHATHVGGIIGGEKNSKYGAEGIAKNVKLMFLRTVGSGDYLDEDMANAITYAVDNGAKIINISITKKTTVNKGAMDSAIQYAMQKDVLIVHSSGNQGSLLSSGLFPSRKYLNGDEAQAWIEVGASNRKDDNSLLYLNSNYGKNIVDIFAPGFEIFATIPNQSYTSLNGTSMAAPIISGIAAILRSEYPEFSAVTIKKIIMNSVRIIDHNVYTKEGLSIPFNLTSLSGGIANLYNALRYAEKLTTQVENSKNNIRE
jgi:subtilisin family serine protease